MKHFIANWGFEERHLFKLMDSFKKKSFLKKKGKKTALGHRHFKGISKENMITWANFPSFIDKSNPRKVITSQGHKALYWRMESKIQVS